METGGLVPLARRAVGEAFDIVMSVALDVGDAEGAHGGEILQQGMTDRVVRSSAVMKR
jgi:hypothetical protein